MAQHKWHKEILHWANGGEIEARFKDEMTGWSEWDSMSSTCRFSDDDWWEYRIKPQPKEPQYLYLYRSEHSEIIYKFFKRGQTVSDDYIYIGKIKLEVEDE